MHKNRATNAMPAEFGRIFEAMPVLDPAAQDWLPDASPAACPAIPPAPLRGRAATALHPGSLPALIVFCERVMAQGE